MGLRLGGLGSGIDTEALIQAILTAERRPLVLVQDRVKQLETQRSLFTELSTKLTALRDAATAIDNRGVAISGPSLDEELLAFKATSSDENLVRATANGSASPGAVSVRVISLASTARRVSGGFASDTAVVANAGDTLGIAFGGAAPISITVGAAGASLVDLRAAINADPNNDGSVRASVVFDGTGYRLLVNGTNAGVANDVTVTTTIAGPGGAAFLDAAAGQDPADARLEVFGLNVTRGSNTISDLVPGVTLDLRGTSASPVNVQVELDDEAVAVKLDTFAKAYNEVVDFIKKQASFDPTTKKAGPLAGDGVLRSIQLDVRRKLIAPYAFAPLNGLADIGVSLDKEGKLSVDRAKLKAVLATDSRAVRQVLGGSGALGGVASELALKLNEIVQSKLDPIPNSTPPKSREIGLLPARGIALTDRIKELKDQITVMEARLEKREKSLVLQFSHLESLLAQLRKQGNSLSGITTPTSRG